jgi:hypothetical protein
MLDFNSGIIVYGWSEGNRKCIINKDWLDTNYIQKFTTDTVNNYPGEIIYGVSCCLDFNNGNVLLDEDSKKHVIDAYAKIVKHNEEYNIIQPKLGFYLAINGQFEWTQYKEYYPNEKINSIEFVI